MTEGYTNPVQMPSMSGPVGMPFPAVSPPMAPLGAAAPTTQAATTAAVATASPVSGISASGVAPGSVAAPQFNPITGENMNPTLFQKGGMLDIGLGALQTLGNLWNSFQQVKLAKDQFSFQKEAWSTNLANQEKTYNTSLQNREESRGSYLGRSAEDTAAYVKEHSL